MSTIIKNQFFANDFAGWVINKSKIARTVSKAHQRPQQIPSPFRVPSKVKAGNLTQGIELGGHDYKLLLQTLF